MERIHEQEAKAREERRNRKEEEGKARTGGEGGWTHMGSPFLSLPVSPTLLPSLPFPLLLVVPRMDMHHIGSEKGGERGGGRVGEGDMER